MERKSLNAPVLGGDFSAGHLMGMRSRVPTMFVSSRSEKEVETAGFVSRLKSGEATTSEIERIVADISEKFGGKNFSFLTTTPDSGNVP